MRAASPAMPPWPSRRTAAAAGELRLHGGEEKAPPAHRWSDRPPLVRAGRARACRASLLPPTARLLQCAVGARSEAGGGAQITTRAGREIGRASCRERG